MDTATALDVWFKFAADDEEESEYEANTYRTRETDRERAGFRVDWYHTAVGQVSSRWFPTYMAACDWLDSEGFQDFSS